MKKFGVSIFALALLTTAAIAQNVTLKERNNQILIDEIKRGFDPAQIAQDAARAKAGEDLSAILKARNQKILIDEVRNGVDPQKIGQDAAMAKAGGALNPAEDASAQNDQTPDNINNKTDTTGNLNNNDGSSGHGSNIGTKDNGGSEDADLKGTSQGGGENSVGQNNGQQPTSGDSGVDSKINGDLSGQSVNSNGSKSGEITTQPNTGGSSGTDLKGTSQGGGENSVGQNNGQQPTSGDSGVESKINGDLSGQSVNSNGSKSGEITTQPNTGGSSGTDLKGTSQGGGENSVGQNNGQQPTSGDSGVDSKINGDLSGQSVNSNGSKSGEITTQPNTGGSSGTDLKGISKGGGENSVGQSTGQQMGQPSNGSGDDIGSKIDNSGNLNSNGNALGDGKDINLNSNGTQGSGQSSAAASGDLGGYNSAGSAQPKHDEADSYNASSSEDDRMAEAMKNTQNNDAAAEQYSHDADKGIVIPKDVNEAAQLFSEMAELYKEFKDYAATANQDRAQDPQMDANAGPGLPVHCKAMDKDSLAAQYNAKKAAIAAGKKPPPEDPNAGQCVPCYVEAEKGIDTRRIAFERLRIILNYTQKMSSQGENALSGFGAAGGSLATMEAQSQIRQVDQAMEAVNSMYDKKYVEIIAKLKGSLDDFAKCEAKYFNNPDWYDRYGFVYYQFMADKYKRN